MLHRLDIAVSCGEDIIFDLRKNNGSKPKFETFWEVRYFSFYFILFLLLLLFVWGSSTSKTSSQLQHRLLAVVRLFSFDAPAGKKLL